MPRGRPKGKLRTARQSHCRDEQGLTAKQRRGIETILDQSPGESLVSLAERAGVSPRALWGWFKKPHFRKALSEAVIEAGLGAKRPVVATALLNAALVPGTPGFASCQRLYWELVGDLPGRLNAFNDLDEGDPNDGDSQSQYGSPINIDALPLEDKLAILEILERNQSTTKLIGQGATDDDSIGMEWIGELPI